MRLGRPRISKNLQFRLPEFQSQSTSVICEEGLAQPDHASETNVQANQKHLRLVKLGLLLTDQLKPTRTLMAGSPAATLPQVTRHRLGNTDSIEFKQAVAVSICCRIYRFAVGFAAVAYYAESRTVTNARPCRVLTM